jgi:L-lactate permease
MLGATSGEILSPLNATVITLVKGVDSSESDLIRSVLWYALFWLVATMILSFLFLVPQPFLD